MFLSKQFKNNFGQTLFIIYLILRKWNVLTPFVFKKERNLNQKEVYHNILIVMSHVQCIFINIDINTMTTELLLTYTPVIIFLPCLNSLSVQ